MSYFEPQTWRMFTKDELLNYIDELDTKAHSRSLKKTAPTSTLRKDDLNSTLVIQQRISPFDLYCYLHARFGEPNGMQTFIRKDDSDNLFHWDYYLKAGNEDIFFIGATQEVHVWVSTTFTDSQWLDLIKAIKEDFARVGREKSTFARTLEKWYIFPNQFYSIAEQCAELHENLERDISEMEKILSKDPVRIVEKSYQDNLTEQGKISRAISSSCILLNILTPIMFESFINILIAILILPDFKKNKRTYDLFIKSPLDVKIYDLHIRCRGFERPITPGNPIMGRYWNVVNRRNDLIHGNVNPVQNAVDIVYFDKKVPLYMAGGDRLEKYWQGLVQQYEPKRVIEDYLAAHELIYEIISHLHAPLRERIMDIIGDNQPGYDEKRDIFGHLFPDHLISMGMDGLRYDGDLKNPAQSSNIENSSA